MYMQKKIKVLNVLPLGTVGGAENFVLSLCRYHNRQHFETSVCILFNGGAVSDRIAATGCKVFMLNMRNGFDIFRVWPLFFLIRKNKIDIVNIHGENPLAKIFAILSRSPVIIHTDHGTTTASPVKRKKRVILCNRLLTPFFDRYIAISKAMRKSLLEREKVPAERITPIYNGVAVQTIARTSCNKEEFKRSLGIPLHTPLLATVGRLAEEKQLPILFQTLSILKARGSDFVTLIIGDGPQRSALEKMIEEMDLGAQVRFMGLRDDVFQLLEISDVFVFSSGGEAFSIALLEAMAKKKPIVAFDVDGVNEAVLPGATGFLVPQGNIEMFAQKIETLLESPELAKEMGRCAQERVRNLFDITENISRLESLYKSLLQDRLFPENEYYLEP